MIRALKVDERDTVAVVLQSVKKGDLVDTGTVLLTAAEDIEKGHKIALREIVPGEMVTKYGVPIGRASAPIPAGAWVHTHNMEDITEDLCREYAERYRTNALF